MRFEQVPIEVAKKALRLDTGRPRAIANGTQLLRNCVPARAGGRRFRNGRSFAPFPGGMN